jgi:hypothetical protein
MQGANGPMRLESEVRRSEVLEQHFIHGKWAIVKVYIRGELREIVVRNRECHNAFMELSLSITPLIVGSMYNQMLGEVRISLGC